MSDVPRPFKQYLPQYKQLEKQLLSVIYEKYLGSSLRDEEQRIIKKIDDDMLYYDLSELLGEQSDQQRPKMKTSFSYEVLPFGTVEKQYLSLFNKYSK